MGLPCVRWSCRRSGSRHHGQCLLSTTCWTGTNLLQYPFEYSKTRVQLLDNSAIRTSNPLRLIFQVAKQEGVGALYTGCTTLIVVSTGRFLNLDLMLIEYTGNHGESCCPICVIRYNPQFPRR